MFKINPYRPGAGLKPMYIAGRDEDIESVEQIFEALTMNVPVQSIIYSGLRGVGKTVLINKLEEILYPIFDYPHEHYTFKHFEV